jgi:hypothetical protein
MANLHQLEIKEGIKQQYVLAKAQYREALVATALKPWQQIIQEVGFSQNAGISIYPNKVKSLSSPVRTGHPGGHINSEYEYQTTANNPQLLPVFCMGSLAYNYCNLFLW